MSQLQRKQDKGKKKKEKPFRAKCFISIYFQCFADVCGASRRLIYLTLAVLIVCIITIIKCNHINLCGY